MNPENKVSLGIAAAALTIGVVYILKMKRLAQELETVTKVNIHKISLSGIELRVDVMMKNPSGGSLKVKFPFVKMFYKGAVFATSEVTDQDYVIPSFGQKQLDPIYISLPFMQLATTVPSMLKDYRKNGSLEIVTRTVTTINNKIPYTKVESMKL
jgi:hypothetical protein